MIDFPCMLVLNLCSKYIKKFFPFPRLSGIRNFIYREIINYILNIYNVIKNIVIFFFNFSLKFTIYINCSPKC